MWSANIVSQPYSICLWSRMSFRTFSRGPRRCCQRAGVTVITIAAIDSFPGLQIKDCFPRSSNRTMSSRIHLCCLWVVWPEPDWLPPSLPPINWHLQRGPGLSQSASVSLFCDCTMLRYIHFCQSNSGAKLLYSNRLRDFLRRSVNLAYSLLEIYLMRIAIPTWNGQISPVFDVASELLLVDVEHGVQVRRDQKLLTATNPAVRAGRVTDLGVDVLICGAISRPLEAILTNAQIRVIPYLRGPAEEILQAFVSGQLNVRSFLMPGCGRRRGRIRGRGRRFGGQRGRRWQP